MISRRQPSKFEPKGVSFHPEDTGLFYRELVLFMWR
jgi:hypothetical protein